MMPKMTLNGCGILLIVAVAALLMLFVWGTSA
jgi:hypothetical protein